MSKHIMVRGFVGCIIGVLLLTSICHGQDTIIDQVNNPTPEGAVNIIADREQTFIPSNASLTAVDVALKTGNPGRGGDQVTLSILGAGGALLTTVTANIPDGFDGFWRFDLPSGGINVKPDVPATIKLQDTGKNVFWWKYRSGNPYRGGQAIVNGQPFGDNDFFFKTYGANKQVDQVNNPITEGAVNFINKDEQTFTPSYQYLTAVEVALKTGNPGRGGDRITLRILKANGNVLSSDTADIPDGFEGFWRFNISNGGYGFIELQHGAIYKIQLQDTGKNVFWWKYKNGNPYPAGQAYFNGQLFGDNDFLFKTYGATRVYRNGPVIIGGSPRKSTPIPVVSPRQSGSFVEITKDIVSQLLSRTSPTGLFRVDVSPPNNPGHPKGAYVATFKNDKGASAGAPIDFHTSNPQVGNIGGVGFSLSDVAIVLDGDASAYQNQLMSFKLRDLKTKTDSQPVSFNWTTPSGKASYSPKIYRSPDGTVLLFITPANVGSAEISATFVDINKLGQIIKQIGTAEISNIISATVTTNNQIRFIYGKQTNITFNIP